jgi:hypothetical protein
MPMPMPVARTKNLGRASSLRVLKEANARVFSSSSRCLGYHAAFRFRARSSGAYNLQLQLDSSSRQNVTDWTGGQQPGFSSLKPSTMY